MALLIVLLNRKNQILKNLKYISDQRKQLIKDHKHLDEAI